MARAKTTYVAVVSPLTKQIEFIPLKVARFGNRKVMPIRPVTGGLKAL